MEKKEYKYADKIADLMCEVGHYVEMWFPYKGIEDFIEQELDKAREEDKYRFTMSEQNGKPYLVIDDMGKGGETVFAGRLEHIQINSLSKLKQ